MDRRAQRKARRRSQVRQEILDAVKKVLLDRGIAGLTLSAVARELELTKAALYYYFPSKDALVFELIYRDLAGHAEAVGEAVAGAASGAEALEALIRTSADHYGNRMDELRLAYLVPQVGAAGAERLDAETLEKIRPFNDRMYGAVANKIGLDQQAGRVSQDIDGRRLAFLAHTSVLGMLTVEGVVAAADRAPLIHSREALVDELVLSFTARLGRPDPE
jgi:AcrR family transcriptional regulator